MWAGQFWLCGYVAASVLWASHGRCLCPLGAASLEYFREVKRQISRFVALMLAQRRRLHAAKHFSASCCIRAGAR
jgi:hypothetical protein